MEIKVKEIFLDEWIKLHQFISNNYDWRNHSHLVYVSDIESVGLTDTHKGKKGDMHQIYRGITLVVKDDISPEKRSELEAIIKQHEIR